MARPKGAAQKRDVSKYQLPDGVTLSPNNPSIYNKETQLEFLDENNTPFISTFKNIQRRLNKTPQQLQKMIDDKVKKLSSKEVRLKAAQTIKSKSDAITTKRRNTMLSKYNVENPMQVKEFRQKMVNTIQERYQVDNVMKRDDIKEMVRNTTKARYGYENPFLDKETQNNIFLNRKTQPSEPELEIMNFIQSLGCRAKKHYTGGNESTNCEIDVFIEDRMLGIEYNGLYWHREGVNNRPNRYHLDKLEKCLKRNITLIQVFEHIWQHRNKQVKAFIKAKLGIFDVKLGARNVKIKQIDKVVAKEFLDEYHIQGRTSFTIAYGVFHKDTLISVFTLGKHHRGKDEIVLSRWVVKEGVLCVGLLSKITAFIKKHHGKVVTWVDRLISEGDNWEKAGWKLERVLKPDYFYYNTKTRTVKSKQSLKKPKNSVSTEKELNAKLGYCRVFDAGKKKFTI